MKRQIFIYPGLTAALFFAGLEPSSAANTPPYYSYYDPIYDSGVVMEELVPQGESLGDALFGTSESRETHLGGFLSSFKLHAAASTSVSYTDNVRLSQDSRKSDIAHNGSASLLADSDWDLHALAFGFAGNLKRWQDVSSENQDGINFFANGKLDITDEWTLSANFNYTKDTEGRDDPEALASDAQLRGIQNYGGGLGLEFAGYPCTVSLRSTINRLTYEKLDGETLGFRDRDVYRYSARIGHPLTESLSVYVQPAYGREIYAESKDASGFARDSSAYELLGGVTYNVTDLTSLDFGMGVVRREFEDSRLQDPQNVAINISLHWAPYEDFSVNTTINRNLASTTLTGVNSITVTQNKLSFANAFRDNLIGTFELGYDMFEFSDSGRVDKDYTAGAGLNYLWSEAINAGVNYRFKTRDSSAINRDFYSNTILLTLSFSL